MINKSQIKEFKSSSFLAKLSAFLKTEEVLVTIYSEDRTESSIEIKFKNREQELIKYMYQVKDNIVKSSIHSIHESLEDLRMRLKVGEAIQSVITYNL